jgi:transposase
VTVAAVAAALRCSEASVYGWTARWRRDGAVGLREGDHGGGKAKLDAAAEERLAALLDTDPQTAGHQATGWTVPLLRGELASAGYHVGERTVRRAIHRLGYRWKRPQYVLGRPDPE